MWKPVKKNEESLGLTASTVGALKEILAQVPDDYILSVTGANVGVLMDEDEKLILIDEVAFLEDLLIEQDQKE